MINYGINRCGNLRQHQIFFLTFNENLKNSIYRKNNEISKLISEKNILDISSNTIRHQAKDLQSLIKARDRHNPGSAHYPEY